MVSACRDVPRVLNVLFMRKVNFRKKTLCFPLRNLRLLYYPGMRYGYNILLSDLRSIIWEVVAYWGLKNKRKFQTFSSESGHGRLYERWSLTWGSKYSYWKWNLLVFWKTGGLRRVGRNRRFACMFIYKFTLVDFLSPTKLYIVLFFFLGRFIAMATAPLLIFIQMIRTKKTCGRKEWAC